MFMKWTESTDPEILFMHNAQTFLFSLKYHYAIGLLKYNTSDLDAQICQI